MAPAEPKRRERAREVAGRGAGRKGSRLPGRSQRGTTLVEFVLGIMILLTMMLGVVEFSRVAYAYHFVSNMARTATRWAALNGHTCANDTSSTDTGGSCNGTDGMHDGPVGPNDQTNAQAQADVQAYVQGHAPEGINPSNLTVTATWLSPTGAPPICTTALSGYTNSPYPNYPGCSVQVKVSYQFNFLFPFVQTGSITLASTSQMVIVH